MSLQIDLFSQTIVVIPTYNESKNINQLVDTLFKLYPTIHLLVVDDNSPDGTSIIVEELQTQEPYKEKLFLLKRPGKLGLGTAYTQGFQWALAHSTLKTKLNYFVQMDADFSHDPASIEEMLVQTQNDASGNADVVIGSRYINGIRIMNWPIGRLLLSYIAGIYTRFVTRMPISDPTGGFKCFRKSALISLDLEKIYSNGYAFQIEMNYKLWKKGLRIVECPIIFYERSVGASKMNKSIVIEAILAVILLRLGIYNCPRYK